jgi:hypothetical protein
MPHGLRRISGCNSCVCMRGVQGRRTTRSQEHSYRKASLVSHGYLAQERPRADLFALGDRSRCIGIGWVVSNCAQQKPTVLPATRPNVNHRPQRARSLRMHACAGTPVLERHPEVDVDKAARNIQLAILRRLAVAGAYCVCVGADGPGRPCTAAAHDTLHRRSRLATHRRIRYGIATADFSVHGMSPAPAFSLHFRRSGTLVSASSTQSLHPKLPYLRPRGVRSPSTLGSTRGTC